MRALAPAPQDGVEIVAAVERRLGLSLRPGIQAILVEVATELIASGQAGSVAELLARVRGAPDDDQVVRELRFAASIGETYFFRHPRQLEALARVVARRVIPLKRARKERRLAVWSVGCSTGEEAYTLAMLLLPWVGDLQLRVIGTDMNERSIERARAGVYGPRSVRDGQRVGASEHLRRQGEGWTVSPELRSCVSFAVHNLVHDPLPQPALGLSGIDVIVCRNVLIYLDGVHLPSVMGKLQATGAPHVVIAVSPAEYSAAAHLHGFSDQGTGLLQRELPSPVRPAPAPPVSSPGAPIQPEKATRSPSPLPPSFEQLLARARAAADQGRYEEAATLSSQAQQLRPDCAELFLLRGSIAMARGQLDEAATQLRGALFLDRGCVAAELGLGQLYRRGGDLALSQRHFARALRLLAPLESGALIPALGVTVEAARQWATGEAS